MAVSTLAAPLLTQDIFQGLTPLQITEIARRAERVIYRPGQTLIEEGEIGDAAILIVTGEAVRTAGPYLESHESIEPGSLIGEMSMLIDREHTSTIVARSDVKALRITRQVLLDQMYEDPALAEHMAGKISRRLDGLIQQLKSIEDILPHELSGSNLPEPGHRPAGASSPRLQVPSLHH